MSYPQALVRALLAAVAGLLLGCIAVALVAGAISQVASPDRFSALSRGWAIAFSVSFFALIYGALPALLFGAPTYAVLLRLGRANALSATLVGAAPAPLLLAFSFEFALLFLANGVAVALCTHWLAAWLTARFAPGTT